jgi:hypothetical protein
MQTNYLKKTGRCMLAFFGICFSPIATAAVQLELVVNTSTAPPTLEVVSNSSQCAGGPLDCIAVAKYTKPNIRFLLEDACKADGPEYKLQQIRIGMVHKVWPSAANPLWADVVDDFHASATTGIIDLDYGKNKLDDDRIKFKNKNSFEYMVFYEITAMHCTASDIITLDPRIRNYGK